MARSLRVPWRDAAVRSRNREGDRQQTRDRGLAEPRRRLRSHADGMARELRARVAFARALWSPVLSDVALLPAHVRRLVPRTTQSAVAAAAVAAGYLIARSASRTA